MVHDKAFRMKLNKEQLLRITLIYQRKFNGLYVWIKNDLSALKSDFSNLETLEFTLNIDTKLSERLMTMERRYYANEQYC